MKSHQSDLISQGGCLCGAVRFELSGPAVWRTLCHCESCRRSTGAPVVAWACFDRARFRIIAGVVSRYESSTGAFRGFCHSCGTTLTYEREPRTGTRDLDARPQEIYIATLAFDDPSMYPPREHVRYRKRIEWLHVADELRRHQQFSSSHGFRQRQKPSIE